MFLSIAAEELKSELCHLPKLQIPLVKEKKIQNIFLIEGQI